jgi:hypothetical protein
VLAPRSREHPIAVRVVERCAAAPRRRDVGLGAPSVLRNGDVPVGRRHMPIVLILPDNRATCGSRCALDGGYSTPLAVLDKRDTLSEARCPAA